MRLSEFRLQHYGPFENLTLALDPEPGRLNIVCAPNGAGKSVLRQAFVDLLFGIAGQSPMGFRYAYTKMRLLATAQTDAGPRSFGRRKGLGNTWIDSEGGALENPPAYGHTDARDLERLFALDSERLRSGGHQLLKDDGAMAEALLGGSGLTGLRARKQKLLDAADALAPSRRIKTMPFYQAIDDMLAQKRREKDQLLRPEAWARMVAEKQRAEASLAAQREAARRAGEEAARLHRIRRVRPSLAAHDAAAAWLAEHPDAPDLPEAAAARLQEAAQRLAIAGKQHADETRRHADLTAQLAQVPAEPGLLAEAAAIDDLSEAAGAVDKRQADLPLLAGELSAAQKRIADLLRNLGAGCTAAEAQALLPTRSLASRARALIAEAAAVAAAHDRAEAAVAAAAGTIAATEASLAALKPPAETGRLSRLVADIGAGGDPERLRAEQALRHARAEAAVTHDLHNVPGWAGDAAGLRALTLAPQARYDQAYRDLTQAEQVLAQADRGLAEAQRAYDKAAHALGELVAAGPIPDRDAVAAARLHRDTGWRLVARLAFGGTPPTVPELAAFAGTDSLALAYERAMRDADRLADRRADESGIVERAAQARRHLVDAETAWRAARDAHAAASARAETARAGWQAMLPACLAADTRLDALHEFIGARRRVLDRLENLETEARAAADLAATHAEWTRQLRDLLGPASDEALGPLLLLAKQTLAAEAASQQERGRLTAAQTECRRHLNDATAERDKAAARLAAWRNDWHSALAALNRPMDEVPAVTADILQELDLLGRDLAKAEDLQTRLDGMRRENAAFTAAVDALLTRLGAPATLDTLAARAAIRAARDQLTTARASHQRRITLTQQIDTAAQTIQRLAQAVAAAQTAFAAALRAIGAADRDEAERKLALSAERARHLRSLADTTLRLQQDGDGLDLAALRLEAASLPAEAVEPALRAAQLAADAAQEAAQKEAAQVAVLGHGLEAQDYDEAYNQAVSARNAAAARAARVLQEATAARLAAAMLDQAMKAVEQAGLHHKLQRIGEIFTTLTGGAYTGLLPAEDGGGRILTAIPAGYPDEAKKVAELSEGTRDQLFLALRLEAIEHHPDRLPFIADDILQSFDDARAEAALHALLALSQRVQVIVLTHHRHILDLAARLPDGSVRRCELAA